MTIEKIFKLTSSVGFIGLLAMVVLMYCQKQAPAVQAKKEVHYYYDSTIREVPVAGAPGTVSFYPVPVDSLARIDTALLKRLVGQYLATYTYSQEIRDTAIAAVIFDSISQNRILGRKFTYKLIKPVRVVESSTVIAQRAGFFLGAFASASKTQFGVGPSASFITKKDALLNARFDFINRAGMIGAEFKIK